MSQITPNTQSLKRENFSQDTLACGTIAVALLIIGYYVAIAALFQTGHLSFTGAVLVGAAPILLLSPLVCLK